MPIFDPIPETKAAREAREQREVNRDDDRRSAGDGRGQRIVREVLAEVDARPGAKSRSDRRAFATNMTWVKDTLRGAASRLKRNEVLTAGERKAFVDAFTAEIASAPAPFQQGALAALDDIIEDVESGGNAVSTIHAAGTELSEMLDGSFAPPAADDAEDEMDPRALADRISRR